MQTQTPSSPGKLTPLSDTVATLGGFDGVHLGHLAVLSMLTALAREHNQESVVITLNPHPRQYFKPDIAPFRLTDSGEQTRLLQQAGVDHHVILPFGEIAALTAATFFSEVLAGKLQIGHLIVGHDQRLGSDLISGVDRLSLAAAGTGITVSEVAQVTDGGKNVSSTTVRSAIAAADLETAKRLLGRHYALCGSVVHGDERGRELGYRTANLEIDALKLLPPHGVYAARVDIAGNWHPAMLYIGIRQTFGLRELSIEVTILDFSGDLYGDRLEVELLKMLRGDQKFASRDELITQIKSDEKATRRLWEAAGG